MAKRSAALQKQLDKFQDAPKLSDLQTKCLNPMVSNGNPSGSCGSAKPAALPQDEDKDQ